MPTRPGPRFGTMTHDKSMAAYFGILLGRHVQDAPMTMLNFFIYFHFFPFHFSTATFRSLLIVLSERRARVRFFGIPRLLARSRRGCITTAVVINLVDGKMFRT